jgi:AcrR family transcriptional regulator/DNA-binding MarR family transcriptional regulator
MGAPAKMHVAEAHSAGRQGGHVEEMQRRRLLLALVEVLAEHGLENASIGRICKRAGVSRRTFYEIFGDRDECLLAAFDAAVDRLAVPVLAAYRAPGAAREKRGAREAQAWRERIRAALTALLEQFDSEPEIARMCVVETLKAGPRVAERRARVLATLVAAVEQGRDEARRGNEPPPLAGQGVVGGALSVIHARLAQTPADGRSQPLSKLTGALMAMIVHPYLGSAAARQELERPVPKAASGANGALKDPFKDLSIRFTYRTARVLATIAAHSGASNRLIADTAGIADEGQTSRLLARLLRAGLIENRGAGREKGEANAWELTERGEAVQAALAGR